MRRAAPIVFAVAVAAVAVALLLDRDDQSRPPVTRQQLERLGMPLGPPDPEQPVVIERERAERVARSAVPSEVLGSVLATCHESDEDVGYPCWAVAHDPAGYRSGGPPGARRIPAAYFVSIVDSRTGEWVGARMGGGGGSAAVRDRDSARTAVEDALLDWTGRHAKCRDGVRPDFRGRPAFRCAAGGAPGGDDACYAVLGDNLFRMGCADARTDTGRLVHRG